MLSSYYNEALMGQLAASGRHRDIVGGMWEEHGDIQLRFLIANGLQPHHKLLDVGCGSLRLGVPAVRYLQPGNYWGTDISQSLLDAGYEAELTPAGLAEKLPRSNLIVDGEFAFDLVPSDVDFVMAQSVFTHLPFNHVRLCLANLADRLTGPCTFFFSFYPAPAGRAALQPYQQFPGVVTHSHRDPYHHSLADLTFANSGLPWDLDYVGDWGHPKDQMMMKATLRR